MREVHDAAPGEQVGQHVGHPGDVVRRYRDQYGFVGAGPAELDRAEQVGHQVAVPQQCRLRFRRGAAGVQHDRHPVVVVRWLDRRCVVGQRCQPLVEHDRGMADDAWCSGDVGEHERIRLAIDQRVEVVVFEAVVDRDERHVAPCCGQQRDGQQGVVLADVDDGVELPADQRGGRAHQRAELRAGDRLIRVRTEHDAFVEPRFDHLQERRQMHARTV